MCPNQSYFSLKHHFYVIILAPIGWLTSSQISFSMGKLYSRSIAIFYSGQSCSVIASSREPGLSAPSLSMLERSILSTRTMCLWDFAIRELKKFAELLGLVSGTVVLILEICLEPYAIWPEYNTRLVRFHVDRLNRDLIGSGTDVRADQ